MRWGIRAVQGEKTGQTRSRTELMRLIDMSDGSECRVDKSRTDQMRDNAE